MRRGPLENITYELIPACPADEPDMYDKYTVYFYFIHRKDPIRFFHFWPQSTWERWQWRLLRITQRSTITAISPLDCLVIYLGHSLGASYLFAELQSVYYKGQANLVFEKKRIFQTKNIFSTMSISSRIKLPTMTKIYVSYPTLDYWGIIAWIRLTGKEKVS